MVDEAEEVQMMPTGKGHAQADIPVGASAETKLTRMNSRTIIVLTNKPPTIPKQAPGRNITQIDIVEGDMTNRDQRSEMGGPAPRIELVLVVDILELKDQPSSGHG